MALLDSLRSEADGAVATLALPAEFPHMHVIFLMAADALGGQFDLLGRLSVAADAGQLGMRAQQRKIRLLGVIELPLIPAIRRVAGRAFPAQSPFVHVLRCMAADALLRRALEPEARMALRARREHVLTDERIGGQIMIEFDSTTPHRAAVAFTAIAAQAAAVRILGRVTGLAVITELLFRQFRRVASMTVEFFVRAEQREVRFLEVIVGEWMPSILSVARRAVVIESAGMRILRRMTTSAILRDLLLDVPRTVTGDAGNVGVCAVEGEPGLLRVIKFRRLPAGRGVALRAVLAAAAAMHIVRRMAIHACLRRAFVAWPEMAGCACDLAVLVTQLEHGLVVLE